ncbi:MAG TPA: hypothetical protein VF747_07235, partial [Blastocatellia bacterium]
MSHSSRAFALNRSRDQFARRPSNRFPQSAILVAALILMSGAPISFIASGAPESSRSYEDGRLGEKKDESDKFKFVRIKGGPMYSGDY